MKQMMGSAVVVVALAVPALAQDYSGIPANVRAQISQKCANTWKDDYSNRAYCIRKDSDGYLELQQLGGTSARATAPSAAPAPSRALAAPTYNIAPARTGAYFANCSAARAAGAAPIRIGEPGYARKLDRDGDGIACE